MSRRLRDLVLVALVIVAPACVAPARASDAEKTFVAQMLPHHDLGMELMEIASTRADDVRLRRLVFEMGDYHHTDMASLSQWAFEWNIASADTFPGSLADSTLAGLRELTGPKFDAAWLDAMIDHHEGALAISRSALAGSVRPELDEMAKATMEVQSREIDEMTSLLTKICNSTPCM